MSTREMEPRNDVREAIAVIRRRWVLHSRLSAAAPWMASAAAALALPLIAVRIWNVHGLSFVLLVAAGVVLALSAMCVAILRMRPVPADRQVARFIEERVASLTGDPSWNDGIVSAVEIGQPGTPRSGAFDALVVAKVASRLRGVDPRHLITTRSMRAAAWSAAAGGACLVLASAASAPSWLRAVDVARARFFPGTIRLDVSPGSVRVPAGTPVRVRTEVRGASAAASMVPVLTVIADDGTRIVPMTSAGGAFEWALPSVERTFSYHVTAGATRSADYTVTAVFPPRVTSIDVSYAYPAFSGLAPREEKDGGDIYAPAGTRIRLRIRTDRAVSSGEVTLSRAPAVAARRADLGSRKAEGVEADLIVTKDDSYRVTLTDAEGLQSRTAVEYFIRPMDDRPPTVRIARPSSDQQISPLEEIAIEARADDDYGVADFDLVYAVSGGRERTVPFTRVSGTEVARVGSRVLSAEELGLRPGDVISYYARARDVGRGKRSTRATSDIYFLEVKPFSEEFAGSATQAAGQGGAAQIDSLVDAQKQIIASTWNIERRSAAGRAPGALKAVTEAQALLRTRAEQMASRSLRRPGRMLIPQSAAAASQQGPASDPLGAAVQAMGKAMEQLETDRTREALPHEMAALNGLLQAQAEVRRREIARQQANGGGSGANRSGQDLSALFDKELQRQQQTNYETPRAAEASETTAPDAALLDRIRELARRQDDLSRRQAAAAQMDENEARRHLEKLTREQAQLRQEAEDLARRARGEPAPSREPSGGSAASERSESLQEAARQMGAAANELRREDAAGAARSGARAAEQLRNFEDRARGRSPGGGARIAAEHETEARQIAQEQRRIASEAERLDRHAASTGADARRGLAAEKTRLADRVEALSRGIEREAGRSQSAASTGAPRRELTNELGSMARRMRDSAETMRNEATGRSGAPQREQELAREMEQLASRVGAGPSEQPAELSQQLERADALRDRLNRLDAQVRASNPRGSSSKEQGREANRRGAGQTTGTPPTSEALPEKYWSELAEARKMLEQLTHGRPAEGSARPVAPKPDGSARDAGGAPEEEQFSRSAPGTEAFKQDRTAWASLRRDIGLALEQYEADVSRRLVRKPAAERLSAGASEQAPEGYQELIARYFESLASLKKAKN